MEQGKNMRFVSEKLNIELISMLSKMDVLAGQVIDEIGPNFVERLELELENSGVIEDVVCANDARNSIRHREARLVLLQVATWLAEQLNDDLRRNRLYRECATTDLLTVFLNTKEMNSMGFAV
jgi:hypothetical protein